MSRYDSVNRNVLSRVLKVFKRWRRHNLRWQAVPHLRSSNRKCSAANSGRDAYQQQTWSRVHSLVNCSTRCSCATLDLSLSCFVSSSWALVCCSASVWSSSRSWNCVSCSLNCITCRHTEKRVTPNYAGTHSTYLITITQYQCKTSY